MINHQHPCLPFRPVDVPSGNIVNYGTTQLTIGWQFSVSTPIYLTALGIFHYNFDGPNEVDAHPVDIWDLSQNLLAQATVPSGPVLNPVSSIGDGVSNFVNLPSLIQLQPGTYRIGAYYADFVDGSDGGSVPINVAPEMTYVGGVLNCCNSLSFPNTLAGTGEFGPNFEFVAPEPSSFALLLLGGLALAARRRRRLA